MKPVEGLFTKMVSLLCLIVLVELICSSSSNIIQVKASVKTQGGEGEDPDSRMDSERADRRDKKGGKGKVHQYFHTSHFCMQVMIKAAPLCLL